MIFKCVGTHAEDLADGRVVAPGEKTNLDEQQVQAPHNKRLLDEGLLIDVTSVKPKSTKKGGGS